MSFASVMTEEVIIPTYEIGSAEKSPIFLENRVYQGSCGKLYPYPTIEKISDEKTDKAYTAVFLENEYIKVMVLPELGGRIQRAYDKTNGYDFVYYNQVIKPALVGLCGPWISGGIEFNWPQHHRPTTFSPVDWLIGESEDGSVWCRVHDVDQMYGTQVMTTFTVRPGKAYIEISSQLYNRTPLPQTFLWWANPAVAVNDNTQSVFPPDVHAVMDHGKRDVSRFPIATGVYYKHDYSAGVDISRYRNVPVPTSYMAEKSDFNFVGGYDYGVEAGLLHIADHHVSPGKKQWTWGNGNFGRAWDRNLTDEDGPYIELMTGVYTDNQPDFSWLKPFEEKRFTQYFMPYKKVGYVKNATLDACLSLEVQDGELNLGVYATGPVEDARIQVLYDGRLLEEISTALSPTEVFQKCWKPAGAEITDETKLTVRAVSGMKILVSYTPLPKSISEMPSPAEAAKDPKDIMTNEELYLTALHIEQYRHATYRPDPYYLEGLKRDPDDIRINCAYGMLLLRRGLFAESEPYFRTAVKRATWKNPNPYCSEPYYDLGLSLFYQKKYNEAYDAFYKATWTNEQQEMSFYYLAAIDAARGDLLGALALCEKSLTKNTRNIKARALKVWLLRQLGEVGAAQDAAEENLSVDTFDYLSRVEQIRLADGFDELQSALWCEFDDLSRGFFETYLNLARDYAEFGAFADAVAVLDRCPGDNPLVQYYKAYYQMLSGADAAVCLETLKQAEACPTDYVFPNKLEDIAVLEYAIETLGGANAPYYLGNLFYDRLQYARAISLWEQSAEKNPSFPIVFRNLSLAYYNKCADGERARIAMEKAWSLNETDPRIFLELDQLYRKLKYSVADRLARYEKYRDVFLQRDDLIIEYVTLLNLQGRYAEAYDMIMAHRFHPWEGGEGKVTTQWTVALVELARQAIAEKDWTKAKELLETAAADYPHNLGEGKIEGCKDNNIQYYLGLVARELGDAETAKACFAAAAVGTDQPAGMMYYNDQPADMIYYQGLAKQEQGDETAAKARFYRLLDYGERHIGDSMRVEYFAVSLPDFLIFDDDLNARNRAHCSYLMGLGHLGLGEKAEAEKYFRAALEEDPFHLNALRYIKMCGE